jgi:hypothetical protein
MGRRMRDKRRPSNPNAVRRSVPLPRVKPPALAHLHHLAPAQLHAIAASTLSEIKRLQGHVKQTQAMIHDLQQMRALMVRFKLQRTPAPDGARSHAEVAAVVLASAGHPMQLKELLAAMAARGAVVAGKTERQRRSNLIITLSRSAMVRRVGHGLYALTESRASA